MKERIKLKDIVDGIEQLYEDEVLSKIVIDSSCEGRLVVDVLKERGIPVEEVNTFAETSTSSL